jgi:hypothetical protein
MPSLRHNPRSERSSSDGQVCKHSEVANLARDGCEAATVPATPPPASYTIQDVWAKVATDNSMSIEELDLAFADPEGLLLSLCSTPGQNGLSCEHCYKRDDEQALISVEMLDPRRVQQHVCEMVQARRRAQRRSG